MPPWTQRILALSLGVAVLAATEAALRATLGPPPPPIQVYNAIGEHDHWLEPRPDGTWLPTYQLHAAPVPADTPVVVLGGSSVHGGTPGLTTAGEFPALTSAELGVPVANLGSPGLDTHDHVAILEALAETTLQPSIVVVYAGHNDFGNARFQARYGTVSAGLAAHTQALLEHFQLYVQLSRTLRPVSGQARQRGVSLDQPSLTEGAHNAALRHLQANLARMVHLTESNGQQLVFMSPLSQLLSPPVDPTCTDTRCPQRDFEAARTLRERDPEGAADLLRRARDHDLAAPRSPTAVATTMTALARDNAHVHVIISEHKVPQAPAVPVPDRRLFADPVHPSAAGHTALATALAQTLAPLLPQ